VALIEFADATNSPSAQLFVPGISGPVTHFKVDVDSLRIKVRGIKWGSVILSAHNFARDKIPKAGRKRTRHSTRHFSSKHPYMVTSRSRSRYEWNKYAKRRKRTGFGMDVEKTSK
jgi:hypothetical protein